MSAPLPVPRPDRKVGPMALVLARASKGIAAVVDQIDPYAEYWDARNDEARSAGRPIWFVLGDSTAQGIGAPRPDQGWVGQLAEAVDRTASTDGQPVPIINLSVSGARSGDLIDVQLPRYEALVAELGTPVLTTVMIGANDVFRSPNISRLRRNLGEIAERLPAGAILASLPQAGASMVAKLANDRLKELADQHGLLIARINRRSDIPYRQRLGQDRFHPSEYGYRVWAEGFAEALGLTLAPMIDPFTPR